MLTAKLKKVGGSTMVAIPPAILEQLGLKAEAQVVMNVDGDRLVLERPKRPKYKLEELLAQCDPKAKRNPELEEWLNAPSAGQEILP